MLKDYPYNVSDDYEELYNYLMKFDKFFVLALINKYKYDDEIFYIKMFKMKKTVYGGVCITDDMNYRTCVESKEDFIKICNELKLYWLVPNQQG